MGIIDMYVNEVLMEIVIVLLSTVIIGAAASFYMLIKCVHKQALDMKVMKKATIICYRFIVKDSKRLHSDKDITDIEKIYKDLIDES